jgi:hypothetical protein
VLTGQKTAYSIAQRVLFTFRINKMKISYRSGGQNNQNLIGDCLVIDHLEGDILCSDSPKLMWLSRPECVTRQQVLASG